MKTNQLCGTCGKPLAPATLLGLCPQCLMKAGLPAPIQSTIPLGADAFVEGPETETKEFVPGTKLGYIGDYELLEEMARGGMGVVYKARQASLKRIVAIKMIRAGELAGETEIRRFRAEAEAAAQLQHPNIVAIHEIGEHAGRQYFSMDFIAGKNLAQFAAGKPVAARPVVDWLKTIAAAVHYAHERGVLHRDLKPQNIMLDAERRPCVTDFGLAKNLAGDGSLTASGVVMGSPNYMSPEQARGLNDQVGRASDVYALGAILYELLTGRPPFHGQSAMDTLSQVVNDEPPRPRSVHASVPAELEAICLKCLEKEPARRYPTARELELDLGRWLAGEPVLAQPASALRLTSSWLRQHRWVFSAAVAALLLTLAGLTYGFFEQTRFLIWHQANTGGDKPPGLRGFGVDLPSRVMIALLLVGGAAGTLGRLAWHKLAAAKSLAALLVKPRAARTFAAGSLIWSLLLIAFALVMTANAIHDYVWSGVWPDWFALGFILLVAWAGMNRLLRLVREQLRIPVAALPEYQASPAFSACLIWIFWGVAILLSSAWILSVPQPAAHGNLIPLFCGLIVAITLRAGRLLLGWEFGREGAGAHRQTWRWFNFLGRTATVSLALGLLMFDLLFVLLIYFSANSNPGYPHAQGFFTCGLVFGGLLVYWTRKKWSPAQPCPAPKPSPITLTPEQLAPIHAAIFAGRTNDACQLYHAANGGNPRQKGLDLLKFRSMEAKLKRSHPDQFSPGALTGPAKNAGAWEWLWPGILLLLGLLLWFLPGQWIGWLVWGLFGLVFGAFIRAMSANRMAGWKAAYRGLRPEIKWGAWLLVGCFALAIPGFATILVGLIHHPLAARHSPDAILAGFAVGVMAGWVLVHWSMGRRKGE